MIIVASLLAAGLFAAGFYYTNFASHTRDAVAVARQATAIIKDRTLDELEKERQVQRATLDLFKRGLYLAFLGVVVLGIPTLALYLLDLAGVVALSDVVSFMLRWDVLLITLVIALAARLLRR